MVKNPPAMQEPQKKVDPWARKIPRGGNGNPLQYSCWENTSDKGAWWATVHGVAELNTTNHKKKKKHKTYK